MGKVNLIALLTPIISFADPCVQILEKLIPEYPGFLRYKVVLQGRVGQNLSGETSLSEPITYGALRVDIPILDNYDKLRIARQKIQDRRNAQQILAEYLSLREEVEDGKKILDWLKARVEQGLDPTEKLLSYELELRKKEQILKSFHALFKASGINDELLDRCWRGEEN